MPYLKHFQLAATRWQGCLLLRERACSWSRPTMMQAVWMTEAPVNASRASPPPRKRPARAQVLRPGW